MGFKNLTEHGKSSPNQVVRYTFLEKVGQLIRKDRDVIDFNAPVELKECKLVTAIFDRDEETNVELPETSNRIMTDVFTDLSVHGAEKGLKVSQPHAHEYFGNPQIIQFLIAHYRSLMRQKELWRGSGMHDQYAENRAKIGIELNQSLAQLVAGRLHLSHRPEQRKSDPKLEELFQSIDKRLIPEVSNNMGESLDYWM